MNKMRGFRIVELILVIAMVAILIFAAFPSYRSYEFHSLENSNRAKEALATHIELFNAVFYESKGIRKKLDGKLVYTGNGFYIYPIITYVEFDGVEYTVESNCEVDGYNNFGVSC